jgi:predicted metal-binding protein
MAQTAAVMSAGPLDAATVASTFTQGRRIVAKVTAGGCPGVRLKKPRCAATKLEKGN